MRIRRGREPEIAKGRGIRTGQCRSIGVCMRFQSSEAGRSERWPRKARLGEVIVDFAECAEDLEKEANVHSYFASLVMEIQAGSEVMAARTFGKRSATGRRGRYNVPTCTGARGAQLAGLSPYNRLL